MFEAPSILRNIRTADQPNFFFSDCELSFIFSVLGVLTSTGLVNALLFIFRNNRVIIIV